MFNDALPVHTPMARRRKVVLRQKNSDIRPTLRRREPMLAKHLRTRPQINRETYKNREVKRNHVIR